MIENELIWDGRLQIQTAGRDDINSDEYRYPYEPTPYCVLERLADSGLIGEGDAVLDYGCGKGRVGFFLSEQTNAKTIGIEYDDRIYEDALANQKSAVSKASFVLTRAEEYALPPDVNRCYFFNPFSGEIFHKVLARILESYYEHPRQILLFFYYPSDEYISCLMGEEALDFYDEIECDDLFAGDPRERILIFELPGYEITDTQEDGTSGKEKQKMEHRKTLEEVRRLFAGDRFATENGAVIDEIGHRSAVCSLHITDSHRNAMGAVMGGVYFMLADFAFAVAANWENMGCVSLRADISFLGAAKGETLTAKAVCVKDGKTTACYRVDMTDSLGNLAATVTVTGYHVG